MMMMLLLRILNLGTATALSTPPLNDIVILGGSGRIGTAIATHLIRRSCDDLSLPSLSPSGKIILVGRNAQQGQDAVQEVQDATSELSSSIPVEFRCISDVWDATQLTKLFS